MVAVAILAGSALGRSRPAACMRWRPSRRCVSQRSRPSAIAARARGSRSASWPASEPIGQPPRAWRCSWSVTSASKPAVDAGPAVKLVQQSVLGAEDGLGGDRNGRTNQVVPILEIVVELAAAGAGACPNVVEADVGRAQFGYEVGCRETIRRLVSRPFAVTGAAVMPRSSQVWTLQSSPSALSWFGRLDPLGCAQGRAATWSRARSGVRSRGHPRPWSRRVDHRQSGDGSCPGRIHASTSQRTGPFAELTEREHEISIPSPGDSQPSHRRAPGPQPEDGPQPRLEHLHEARLDRPRGARLDRPRGGDRTRPRGRAGPCIAVDRTGQNPFPPTPVAAEVSGTIR